jgi:hypothetical protein
MRMAVPHGHWKTTTLIAGMRSTGVVAPFVIDSPVNRLIFEAWVEQALVPELRPGDIVVMDNLSSHKGPAVQAKRKKPPSAKPMGVLAGSSSCAAFPGAGCVAPSW